MDLMSLIVSYFEMETVEIVSIYTNNDRASFDFRTEVFKVTDFNNEFIIISEKKEASKVFVMREKDIICVQIKRYNNVEQSKRYQN